MLISVRPGEHCDLNGVGNDEQGNDGEDDDDCEACHAHDHIDVRKLCGNVAVIGVVIHALNGLYLLYSFVIFGEIMHGNLISVRQRVFVAVQTLQHNGVFAEQVHHVGKTVVFRHKGALAHVFNALNLVANLHGGK